MKLTFDTNCLIDLETKRDGWVATNQIVELWKNNEVDLAVTAITASEKRLEGVEITNYSQFQSFLSEIGLSEVEALKPIGYYNITFLDWMLWSGDELTDLEEKIHNVLFPNTPYKVDNSIYKKWLNAKVDVLVAWSHIWNSRDILITRDINFHKKESSLKELGIGNVMSPEKFLENYAVSKT